MIFEINKNVKELYRAIRMLALQTMPERAEDLTQEVALRLWSKKAKVPGRFQTAYLRRVVLNTAADLYRKEHKYEMITGQYFMNEDGSISFSGQPGVKFYVAEPECDYLESQEKLAQFSTALARLNPEQRELIHLMASGFKLGEIAVKQSVCESTIRTRLHYARKHLRKSLRTNRNA